MRFGNIDGQVDGIWQVVHDSGEFSSAGAYDITGLHGDTDIEYYAIVRCVSGNASTVANRIQLNGDNAAHYGYQFVFGTASTPSASRNTSENGLYINVAGTTGRIGFSTTHIFAKSGKERTAICNHVQAVNGTAMLRIVGAGSVWSNTADEITYLRFVANLVNGFGAGSRIILLRKVHATDGMMTGVLTPNKIEGAWERIYSNTLSSSVATVTISSLTGNTDQLYRLIVRGVDTGGFSTWRVRLNADTGANYGIQLLKASNTTVSSAADASATSVRIGGTATGNLCMGDLLLYAKSGYVRTSLCSETNLITGTTVGEVILSGGSWNNSADEITSIGLSGSGGGSMNAGTTIELYRLNL